MKKTISITFLAFLAFFILALLPVSNSDEIKDLSPSNYNYQDAAFCLTCKTEGNRIMPPAIGVKLEAGDLTKTGKGWLASGHATAQSHEKPITSYCAKCHFPTYDNVTTEEEKAVAIPVGQWQGITCRACHSSNLPRELRKSTLINFKAGSKKDDPANYIFIDKRDGKQQNSQCLFCHGKIHEFTSAVKNVTLKEGALRCIDCHMAGFKRHEYTTARFHNMKVKENLPWSCGSKLGNGAACHHQESQTWMNEKITSILKN